MLHIPRDYVSRPKEWVLEKGKKEENRFKKQKEKGFGPAAFCSLLISKIENKIITILFVNYNGIRSMLPKKKASS
jgi:hypothetical protein